MNASSIMLGERYAVDTALLRTRHGNSIEDVLIHERHTVRRDRGVLIRDYFIGTTINGEAIECEAADILHAIIKVTS